MGRPGLALGVRDYPNPLVVAVPMERGEVVTVEPAMRVAAVAVSG